MSGIGWLRLLTKTVLPQNVVIPVYQTTLPLK